jgi:hypothetical protein
VINASNSSVNDGSSAMTSDWAAKDETKHDESAVSEHAVLSTFDLFSIGIGPSSSVSRERNQIKE